MIKVGSHPFLQFRLYNFCLPDTIFCNMIKYMQNASKKFTVWSLFFITWHETRAVKLMKLLVMTFQYRQFMRIVKNTKKPKITLLNWTEISLQVRQAYLHNVSFHLPPRPSPVFIPRTILDSHIIGKNREISEIPSK